MSVVLNTWGLRPLVGPANNFCLRLGYIGDAEVKVFRESKLGRIFEENPWECVVVLLRANKLAGRTVKVHIRSVLSAQPLHPFLFPLA